jgi:hypothetical protein
MVFLRGTILGRLVIWGYENKKGWEPLHWRNSLAKKHTQFVNSKYKIKVMDILNLLFVNMMIKQFIVSEVNKLLMETLYKEKKLHQELW